MTGVSRRIGIGFAIARRLAAVPMNVLACSWAPHDDEQPWGADPIGSEAVITALRESAGPETGRIAHLEADLADPDGPARVFTAAQREFGSVDVLVANHARSADGALGNLTATELDQCWAVNVRATLLLVQEFAALPGLRDGRIVTMTSGQYQHPMPAELPYSVTKGAVQQMTISLAAALAHRGITVNCVNPGPVDTGYAPPEQRAHLAAAHPRGRWGHPDQVADLVSWLVSEQADWITGQTIASDGGWALCARVKAGG